ncbi:MAG TPA: tRNA (cytidine(34)-2'-O)-methyltransferase [Burkholderiales bacterium]|nr:tRNA (cytidine(34)-2'-O)-methyltransferase [Burkholderiales bacterium]
MFDVVLFQPEIPPNTGNVLRLCANTGCQLHLVKPLGFLLTDRALARAGLDYDDIRSAVIHDDWDAALARLSRRRLFGFSTRAAGSYADARYAADDTFVFGPETGGLPDAVLETIPPTQRLRLPMVAGSRSLNLSNAVAVVVYEAWRQVGFAGAAPNGRRV